MTFFTCDLLVYFFILAFFNKLLTLLYTCLIEESLIQAPVLQGRKQNSGCCDIRPCGAEHDMTEDTKAFGLPNEGDNSGRNFRSNILRYRSRTFKGPSSQSEIDQPKEPVVSVVRGNLQKHPTNSNEPTGQNVQTLKITVNGREIILTTGRK